MPPPPPHQSEEAVLEEQQLPLMRRCCLLGDNLLLGFYSVHKEKPWQQLQRNTQHRHRLHLKPSPP